MLFPLTRPAAGEPAPPGSPPLKPGTTTAAAGDDAAPAAPATPCPAAAAVDRRAPIAAGDTVIVYESHTSMKAVRVTEDATFGNRFGQFRVKDWIGLPYGARATTTAGTGWVYLLAPTPELWTRALPHRTQILYAADIAAVCAGLDLAPGCVVLECGTGSGSLTHALARSVHPGGAVHTFEFHAERAARAKAEFEGHGLGAVVTCYVRDVEAGGFDPALETGAADAVFLDLPGPWKAVPSAAACLRPDGVLCAFSPCIEQVQATAAALAGNGFVAISTQELLLRDYEVRRQRLVGGGDGWEQGLVVEVGGRGGGGKGAGGGGGGGEAAAPVPPQPRGVPTAVHPQVVAWPVAEARGHTGYLTFARRAV